MSKTSELLKGYKHRNRAAFLLVIIVFFAILIEAIILGALARSNTGRSVTMLLDHAKVILENNDQRSATIIDELKDDYIARAKSVAYLLQMNPSVKSDVAELKHICELMKIDEIHIFDATGNIFAGTHPQYYGYNFDSGEQMGYFKPMLKDKKLSMCQDVTPNTAEGHQIMYAITWNEAGTEMVQVGITPARLNKDQHKNEISAIVDNIPAYDGMNIYIFNNETKELLGTTNKKNDIKSFADMGLELSPKGKKGWEFFFGTPCSYEYQPYGKYMVMVTNSSQSESRGNLVALMIEFFYLLLAGLIVVYMVRRLYVANAIQEDQLKRLNEHEQIMNNAGLGMWYIILKDGAEPRMKANKKMLEIMGVKEELTEEQVYDFWYSRIMPDAIPSVQKSVGEMMNGQFSENTYQWTHPDKGVIYTRCGGTAITLPDGTKQLSGYHYDVTNIVEEELQQQQALAEALKNAEHANAAKTTFLNSMSHDIRTPMNAIVGFTALAAKHLDNAEMMKGYLAKITVSSKHLLSLINDVLDMSRIESGKVNIEGEEAHLPDIINELCTITQANVAAKNLTLKIDTCKVWHEDVIADKLRLSQILMNIVSNAIKYTNPGGKINIGVTEKECDVMGFADYEFKVADTGIGMSEEFQEHIFEAFTREETSTVSGIQGTGLGMAITKNLVDLMNGHISVKSELGKGSEFKVELRFAVPANKERALVIPQLQGKRTLIVDSNANACLIYDDMMRQMGLKPDWTVTGADASIRAQRSYDSLDPYAVYVVNEKLFGMTGLEVVRQLREIIGSEPRVVMMTDDNKADIEKEAREAGVDGFCGVPKFVSDLREALVKPYEENQIKSTEEKLDFTGKRILLVEDNELNQEIAQTILEEHDLKVDIANDGSVAVDKMKKAAEGYYDMILMDVQMPIMNGYDATRAIRKLENTQNANVPIVAMTANAFKEDKKLAFDAGMNEHLAKPINIEELMKVLKKILG